MATMTNHPKRANWWVWGGAAAAALVVAAALSWSFDLFGTQAAAPAAAPAAEASE